MAQDGEVGGFYRIPSLQPRLGLGDGRVTEILAVRDMDALTAQLTQHIVHQFVYTVGNGNTSHVPLHFFQFVQRNQRCGQGL